MIDTHCHIHDDEFTLNADEVLDRARLVGVEQVICVGTNARYSKQAIEFAKVRDGVGASVGLHPHDAKDIRQMQAIAELAKSGGIVAIGECGLDYYYDNSPRDLQKQVLLNHFEIAQEHNLPMIFHVRGSKDDPTDAFSDFWKIYDKFTPRGVVHSFSSSVENLKHIIERNLYVGVNGIVTFMKDENQLAAIREIPLQNLVLETDSPLLTPVPFRGTINEPKHISVILGFLSQLRGEPEKQIAATTTNNAKQLFNL